MSFIVLSFHRPEHGLDQIYRDASSRCSPFSSRLTKSVLNVVYELQITINTNNQVLEVLAHMVFFSAGAWVLICGFGWYAFCFSAYTSLCMIQRVSLLKKAKAKVINRSLFLTSFFSTSSVLKLWMAGVWTTHTFSFPHKSVFQNITVNLSKRKKILNFAIHHVL